MQIGRLRQRITLQRQHYRQNDYGASIAEWQDIATVWAEVKPLTGREFFTAQQIQSEITTQITIRYLDNIDTTGRVLFGSHQYEILSVMNSQERNISLQLMCKELTNERHSEN